MNADAAAVRAEGLARIAGRARIAKLAIAGDERRFAYEVLAGCWDHKDDVAGAIREERARQGL